MMCTAAKIRGSPPLIRAEQLSLSHRGSVGAGWKMYYMYAWHELAALAKLVVSMHAHARVLGCTLRIHAFQCVLVIVVCELSWKTYHTYIGASLRCSHSYLSICMFTRACLDLSHAYMHAGVCLSRWRARISARTVGHCRRACISCEETNTTLVPGSAK